jgi:uncharacterized protein
MVSYWDEKVDVRLAHMNFDFDLGKDALNLAQHGVSMVFGVHIFSDRVHLVVPSFRREDSEDRWKVIGKVDGDFYSAVHVWRGDIIRFISVRRSNAGEEGSYHSAASGPK